MKAVIFDLDNTLYDYSAAHAAAFEALTAYAQAVLGIEPTRFNALHDAADAELKARCGANQAAIHNRLIRYQVLLEGLGLPIAHAPRMAEAYWGTMMANLHAMPGARETLRRLRGMGLRVGVGTNMTADRQYEKLARLDLLDGVDFMVTSEEVTSEKPDGRLFAFCAQKAGCAAGECAFVGDSLRGDVLGALNAGMKAVWFRPNGDASGLPEGARVIRTLDELPALLPLL